MKQGNPNKKRFGLVALISAMIAGIVSRPEGTTDAELHNRKVSLLTNNGRAPIPSRLMNQRQKRKVERQTGIRK